MFPTTVLRRHIHLKLLSLHHIRHLSTTTTQPQPQSHPNLSLSHPTYLIWGSGTGIGKTLVSTGLAASSLLSSPTKFLYTKPIQTGFPSDSDSKFVYTKLVDLFQRRKPQSLSLFASNHTIKASIKAAGDECGTGMRNFGAYEESRVGCEGFLVGERKSELICKTLYAWNEAVSPHLAAEREGGGVKDEELLEMLGRCLRIGDEDDENMRVMSVVETAGGVLSPGASGSFQGDLYRPFRLPAILVGDGRLGGISGTLSAYESLKLRGYDVAAIVFEDHGLANEVPLLSYLRNRVPVLVLPPVPEDLSNDLMEWFDESQVVFQSLEEVMLSSFTKRIHRLREMASKAGDLIWWPFTQHKLVPQQTVTVIDSRCGENFAVYKAKDSEFITQQFDACASWWTQGPDATLQTELARDMGYAAARFGHVMFPENIYEPALECAELLLEGVGKGWASRVFYSDNGSTAIEISLKMAFRKFCSDHGILSDILKNGRSEKCVELRVLALSGSYHGDTLGAMEAQAPSSYTGFLQQPWYTGRGVFLDPPTVFLCDGIWKISFPKDERFENLNLKGMTFSSRDEIFNKTRDSSELHKIYSEHITRQLLLHKGMGSSSHIGALILEPVIQGAGGMHMVDPLFQRTLVNVCRGKNIPIIFDEVFTGFWRLGVETAAELLCCKPDIACFAKLMTGGVIPLSATLASDAVFSAFIGDSKLKALLHGHSYSAHAIGCTAAAKSIKWFKDPMTNCNIYPEGGVLRELWDVELVRRISSHPAIERVVALGTLCALELRVDGSNAGYASLYASSLVQKLREDDVYMRALGNVIYLMCGPCTSTDVCNQILHKVYRRIEEFSQVKENVKSCEL